MVRHSLSKLQGILEMPGFKGYPTGGNLESGFSSEAAEKQKPFEIPAARIMPKLNNGRRWTHQNEVMPQHREDAYRKYSNSLTRMNATPLSLSTTQTDKANNPETAAYMNKKSIPFYDDLNDVQKQADVQRALADASEDGLGRTPTLSELKEAGRLPRVGLPKKGVQRLSEKAPIAGDKEMTFDITIRDENQFDLRDFFQKAREIRQREVAAQLIHKGFPEEKVAQHFEKEMERDIATAAKAPLDPDYMSQVALASIRSQHTGMNATGIVALGATQTPQVQQTDLRSDVQARLMRNAIQATQPADWGQPSTEVDEVTSLRDSTATFGRGYGGRKKTKKTLGNVFVLEGV
jgi:hypothetical protein